MKSKRIKTFSSVSVIVFILGLLYIAERIDNYWKKRRIQLKKKKI